MKNIELQLAEIDDSLANYQMQLSKLRVEILKLELKKLYNHYYSPTWDNLTNYTLSSRQLTKLSCQNFG